MGLFGLIKDTRNLMKEIKEGIKNAKRYVSMSDEEVLALDDKEFYDAVFSRIGDKVNKVDNKGNNFINLDALNEYQFAFFVLYEFVLDMQDGGLCQYLCNLITVTVQDTSDCLKTMGFDKIAELFDDFVFGNDIDLSMLDDEGLDNEEFYESYDFDSFDEKFYEIYESEPIYDTLVKFARENYDTLSE